jgi:hypothetical protein
MEIWYRFPFDQANANANANANSNRPPHLAGIVVYGDGQKYIENESHGQ